jgi:D-serine deaminase-like pyridoxal phosphate-dependent protein
MALLADLPTPALVLDHEVMDRNLAVMARRAAAWRVALRPHVKTHKCVEIAERQRALGARGITVSTLAEARVFADHGFDDLTWAFPLVPSRLAEAQSLAERVTLRVVVDSPEAVDALEATGHPFHVWLKVDCGYHRAGVAPDGEQALLLARRLAASARLRFDGLLSHSGHAYRQGRDGAAAAEGEEVAVMSRLAGRLAGEGVEVPEVSVGSTPGLAAAGPLPNVTEIRPGNYVFHDATQIALGACGIEDCALTVLATVVSCQPGARHAVVDAGALALSKDAGPPGLGLAMGAIYRDHGGDHGRDHGRGEGRDGGGQGRAELEPELTLTSLTQEHGIVSGPLPVGRRIRILPNHSCLAAACFDTVHVAEGERVVASWKIWRQR